MKGSHVLTALILTFLLTGCFIRSAAFSEADNRLVWDEDGCGFYVKPTSYNGVHLIRTPASDQATCVSPVPEDITNDAAHAVLLRDVNGCAFVYFKPSKGWKDYKIRRTPEFDGVACESVDREST